MINLLITLLGATLTAWLFLWRRVGDRWGWFGMLNAWAEWGAYMLVGVGLLALIRKERYTGAALLGAATIALAPLTHLPLRRALRAPFSAHTTPSFTVFSANLFKRSDSMQAHIELIQQYRPDVICLQELLPYFTEELLAAVGDDYPYQALRPEKDSYGFGVVSRYPIVENGFWNRPGVKAWGQRVEMTLPSGDVVDIYNVHLFPPTAAEARVDLTSSFRAREGQIALMQAEMAERNLPALVIGDCNFNDTSTAYRLATATWTDSAREAGRGIRYTWPTQSFPGKRMRYNPRMLRLDYCFHNSKLTTHAFEVISQRTGSDHTPLFATLALCNSSDD